MDFTNVTVSPASKILYRYFLIDVFEFLLLVISIVIVFLIFYLFISNGSHHIHLIRFIQICGSFFVLSVLCRMAILFGKIMEIEKLDIDEIFFVYGPRILTHIGIFGYLQIFRGFFACCAVIVFVCILYERILATFMYKTYENWRNGFVVLLPFVFAPSASSLFLFLLLSGVHPIYLFFLCLPFGSVAFVLLFGSYFYNLYQYKRSQKLHTYSLSQKFQLSENIRVIDLIWKACFILCIDCGCGLLLFLLSIFIENAMLKYCFIIMLNYIVATALISIILTLLITPTWRILFLSKLRAFFKIFTKASNVEDINLALQNVKTLQGKRLVLSTSEEQELYFQQLISSWK